MKVDENKGQVVGKGEETAGVHGLETISDNEAKESKEMMATVKKNLDNLNDKLDKLEERFAYDEIDWEIFDKVSRKLRKEINDVSCQQRKLSFDLSNRIYSSIIPLKSLQIFRNSGFQVIMTANETCKMCSSLRELCMTRKFGNYRTTKVNSVIELTRSFSNNLGGNKNGQTKNFLEMPALVVPSGRISNFYLEDLTRFRDLS